MALTQNLPFSTTVQIVGSGPLITSHADLTNVAEAVDVDTIGTGVWNLNGNDRLEFMRSVTGSETFNLLQTRP